MKKVSFIKDQFCTPSDVRYLSDEVIEKYFEEDKTIEYHAYFCTESFTAEISVKIVPYEGS